MTVQFTQQMGTHSRDWGNRSGAWIGYALAPAETQGGDHVVVAGSAVLSCCGSARLLTSLNWPGRFANRRSGLFHIQDCSPPTPGLSDRQRVGAFPPPRTRLAATLSLRLMGRSRQFGFPQHSTRQSSNAAEAHPERLSSRVGFNTNTHRERHLEPCSLNQGKRLPQ